MIFDPPILSMGTRQVWMAPRGPTNNEEARIESMNFWFNSLDNMFFICTDATPGSLIWLQIATMA